MFTSRRNRRSSSHVCDGTTTKTSKRTETKVRTIEKTETVTSDSEGDGEGKGRGKKRQECPPYTPPHRGPPGLYRPPDKKRVVQTVPVQVVKAHDVKALDGVVSDVKRIHKSTKHLTEQNNVWCARSVGMLLSSHTRRPNMPKKRRGPKGPSYRGPRRSRRSSMRRQGAWRSRWQSR